MHGRRPLLIPLTAFSSGLAASYHLGILSPAWVPVAAFLICVLALHSAGVWIQAASVAAFFCCFGLYALTPWLLSGPVPGDIAAYAGRGAVIVQGSVKGRPVLLQSGGSLCVRVDAVCENGQWAQAAGLLQVSVTEGEIGAMRGDVVRFETRVRVPRLLGLPGEFDYGRHLKLRAVRATGHVARGSMLALVRGSERDHFMRRIDRAAMVLGDHVRGSVASVEISSVLNALLLGDQRRIPQPLTDAYTRSGVNHILSISGFHVGIIAWGVVTVALFLLTRFEWLALRFDLRRAAVLSAVPAMLAYMLLTGAAPATVRSVVMLCLFAAALYCARETDPVNILTLTALIMVAVDPPSLFDISFQLSFLALWGLIIAAPVAERLAGGCRWRPVRWCIVLLIASFAASCTTALPVMHYFGEASLNGIISNFLIVPLMGYAAVLTGFCALLLTGVAAPVSGFLLQVAGWFVGISNHIVRFFEHAPFRWSAAVSEVDLLLFVGALLALTLIEDKRRAVLGCMLPLSAAVLMHAGSGHAGDGRLHVTLLSVGQAESMLIRFPDGAAYLVDSGGYLYDTGRDFGRAVLIPALTRLGVERFEALVLTHSHPDHAGGMASVVERFPVMQLVTSPEAAPEMPRRLNEAAVLRGVPLRLVSAGDVIRRPDGSRLTVLSPPGKGRGGGSSGGDANESSLVFRLDYGRTGMLLMADAGFETESRLLSASAPLAAGVLKVGHHGSRSATSDPFLDRVRPHIAVISAGCGNSFNLPSPETIEQFTRRRITLYRTDRDGTVELVSDGSSWRVSAPWCRGSCEPDG